MLNKKLKSFFKENGYVIIKNFFDKKKTKDILSLLEYFSEKDFPPFINVHRFDYLLAQSCEKLINLSSVKEKADFIIKAMQTSEKLKKYFLDQKINKYLTFLFGKRCIGLQTQMIFKKPRTYYSKMAHRPHQDNSYGNNEKGLFFTAHIFLENISKKNGTLYVYPGSHKMGTLDFEPHLSYRNKILKPGNEVNLSNIKLKKLDLNAKKGDFLVMDGLLVHGSYANKSKKLSRPIFCGCYIPRGEKFDVGKNADRKAYEFAN